MNKSKYIISSKLSAADTACRIMTHNSPPRDSAKQYLAASTIKISAWHQKQDKSRQEKKCVQGTRNIHHEITVPENFLYCKWFGGGDSWLYHWEVSVTTWMWWFGFSPSAPPHHHKILEKGRKYHARRMSHQVGMHTKAPPPQRTREPYIVRTSQ